VADRADRLVLLDERPDELHRVRVGAQHVGVGDAARQHERIVVGGLGVGDRLGGLDLVALVEVLPHLYLALLERDDVNVSPRLADRLERLGYLDLLGALGEQERHVLALELISHG
jgi:hypothetical protein